MRYIPFWMDFQDNNRFQLHQKCHNPNLGLTTKAKACTSAGQEGSPGGTSYTLKSARECERMNPHTPK